MLMKNAADLCAVEEAFRTMAARRGASPKRTPIFNRPSIVLSFILTVINLSTDFGVFSPAGQKAGPFSARVYHPAALRGPSSAEAIRRGNGRFP